MGVSVTPLEREDIADLANELPALIVEEARELREPFPIAMHRDIYGTPGRVAASLSPDLGDRREASHSLRLDGVLRGMATVRLEEQPPAANNQEPDFFVNYWLSPLASDQDHEQVAQQLIRIVCETSQGLSESETCRVNSVSIMDSRFNRGLLAYLEPYALNVVRIEDSRPDTFEHTLPDASGIIFAKYAAHITIGDFLNDPVVLGS